MSMSEPPSSPLGGDLTPEEQIAWYKSNYEQLETELAEFRVSSQELEHELEKDLEAAEKRENTLRNKAESLAYEVDEWKRKYKDSKAEANAAQNTLEKEITALRDTNRTLQHKLRDIEVANDDFERQARHTNSSLEDLESKYNAAIERSVMMEEEYKIGEQEREQLRIETQRLKEELSDLKVEAEILQDKLKKQGRDRHLSTISTDISVLESPMFDRNTVSGASSPIVSTPPETASVSSTKTPVNEPPSPPMSDASVPPPLPKPAKVPPIKTPVTGPTRQKKSRLPSMDSSVTPRPRLSSSASSRPPTRSATVSGRTSTTAPRPMPPKPAGPRAPPKGIAPSTSLSHIRSLTAQMQRLEARVQSARSKLPGPTLTPPRASPRTSLMDPGNITIRTRKRGPGSVSSVTTSTTTDSTPTGTGFNRSVNGGHISRLSTSGVSRLSFGPAPNRGPHDSGSEISRPSSRTSVSSYQRPMSRNDGRYDNNIAPPRPGSRAGARTPLGRPISRASFSNSFHGHTMSLSYSTAEEEEPDDREYRTPSRRGTYSRMGGIPTPSGIPMPNSRRPSQASVGLQPPSRRPSLAAALTGKYSNHSTDLGETY